MTAEPLALQKRGLRDWIRILGSSSPGARIVELDGITASVTPVCPGRSICNSVTYDEPEALVTQLTSLADIYESAGIAAWTVWTPELEREAVETLEGAGHALDATPAAMSLDLERFDPPEVGDLDWDREVDTPVLGRINELAYGLPTDSGFAEALAEIGSPVALYQARSGGETACVLGTMDHDSDLGFYFVATHPDHRGLGLASRLMTVALLDARERGFRTSSLQGSPMGRPIYRRLGYSEDFTLRMYERRRHQ